MHRVLVECHLATQTDYRQLGVVLDVLSRAGFTVAMNSYGPWRDLVRQHIPAPLHAEQYLLVSAWRPEAVAAEGNVSENCVPPPASSRVRAMLPWRSPLR